MSPTRPAAVAFAWLLGLTTASAASTSNPNPAQWQPGFGAAEMSDRINAFAHFDGGAGDSLVAVGRFTSAGGVPANRIARLQGANWAPLSSGMNGEVSAAVEFDDGNGPALYAAGSFSTAGGVPANRIAKWDGTQWTALGSGLDQAAYALAVYDDGGGPALYVGGNFTTAGGVPASRVAKWNGSQWSALGSGTNNVVRCMTVFDAGNGPRLYVGGEFNLAGGLSCYGIARWNGTAWTQVWNPGAGSPGVGAGGNAGWVHAMVVHDFGSGPSLFVGGSFTSAGITTANFVARWNGTNWLGVGGGVDSVVYGLAIVDDGGGPALYAGGEFIKAAGLPAQRVAKWNGTTWSAVGTPGVNNTVRALAAYDDGAAPGQELYAGGDFTSAGSITTLAIARWNGAAWTTVGQGTNGEVLALASFDDGNGPALYAGGTFTTVAGKPIARIAKWDGSEWSALGTGIPGATSGVFALTVFDDGSGPALYVGGDFTSAGGVAASRIARWNGTTWSALGAGVGDQVRAMCAFDDGNGPALYVGGWFTSAGGSPANRIAKWDGTTWTTLGTGMNNWVYALEVHDDGLGGGAQLYAGGGFTSAGTVGANRVARWDGAQWSLLGNGVNNWVYALKSFDDGQGGGSQLYVGGNFTSAGPAAAVRMARWNGAAWAPVGAGMNIDVRTLAAFDERTGAGPQLFAAGWFTSVGVTPTNRIAKWDGSAWQPLGTGMNNLVDTMIVHDDANGGGPSLFCAGNFTTAGDLGAGRIARWGKSPPPSAWTDQGSALAGANGAPLLVGSGTLVTNSINSVDLSNAAGNAPAVLFVALSSTPVAFYGGTLLAFPTLPPIVLTLPPSGELAIPFVMPPGAPSGTALWLQYAIQDVGAVQGVALSNAIVGITP